MSPAVLSVLLCVVSLVLAAALIALLLSDRDARQFREAQRQQDRITRAELDETRTAFHRVQVERDLARRTVRDLLDIYKAAGHRWPMPMPMPMPVDVDDALTQEFTAIVRPQWPEAQA